MTRDNKFIFNDISGISEFLAERWKDISEEAIRKRGVFTVALSGGKGSKKLYRNLSKIGRSFAWGKTHIFIVDERFIPHNSPDSNFLMIKKNLLKNIRIPKKNIHCVYTKRTLEEEVESYKKNIRNHFKLKSNELPRFDLILLGIGEDGHAASLFPDTDFHHKKEYLVSTAYSKKANNHRITLTLSVLNNACNVVFIVTDKRKKGVLKKVFKKGCALPAALVKPRRGKLYFLLDRKTS